jgi:hypothetical protein
VCDYDDTGYEITREWRRARKPHACFACGETVRVGDRYHVVIDVSDGLRVYRHDARCWSIIEALWSAGAEAVMWDLNCGESWEENFGDLPDDVAALAFMTPDEAQALVGQ